MEDTVTETNLYATKGGTAGVVARLWVLEGRLALWGNTVAGARGPEGAHMEWRGRGRPLPQLRIVLSFSGQATLLDSTLT